jgi:hypothetical protein
MQVGGQGTCSEKYFDTPISLTVQSTLHLHALFPVSLATVFFQIHFVGPYAL